MASIDLDRMLADAVGDRYLLRHPFYRRWEAGGLRPAELAAYAEQYRHVEVAVPALLAIVAGALPQGRPRALVEANLAEERGTPTPHVELFEGFAGAVGAVPGAPATAATTALVTTQSRAAAAGPEEGLAALAVYEVQAAAIATSKAAGLRDHYGIDGQGTAFWDTHAAVEVEHARWLVEALSSLAPRPALVSSTARRAAGAWWAFLDEREAEGRTAA